MQQTSLEMKILEIVTLKTGEVTIFLSREP